MFNQIEEGRNLGLGFTWTRPGRKTPHSKRTLKDGL